MAIYQVIEGDQVVNTVVADADFMVAAYPANNYREVPQELPDLPAQTYGTKITVLAFRQRFTMAEKTAIELASLDNPGGTTAERKQAAALRAYLGDLAVATFIDLERADTIESVKQLEASGLLDQGRAAGILEGAVQWAELPNNVQLGVRA